MHQKVKKNNDVNNFKIGRRHQWTSELEYSAFGMHMHGIGKQDFSKTYFLVFGWLVLLIEY